MVEMTGMIFNTLDIYNELEPNDKWVEKRDDAWFAEEQKRYGWSNIVGSYVMDQSSHLGQILFLKKE
jgi:hypothetical protein